MFIHKMREGRKYCFFTLKKIDPVRQALCHFFTRAVAYDERQVEFRVVVQRIEFPRMEISGQVTVVTECAMAQPTVQSKRKIMARQPEQRKTQPRTDRSRNLPHAGFHKESAWSGKVHVSAGNESGVQRRIIRSEERRVGKECRSRWSPYH